MSINQSDNKSNIFFLRETNHNLMSLCYFSLLSLSVIIIFLISIILGYYPAAAYLFIVLIFLIMKCGSQIKIIANFKTLTSKIEDGNLSHYITKSWMRKRNSTIWIGFSSLLFTVIMLIVSISLISVIKEDSVFIGNITIIVVGMFIILLTMYSNMQTLNTSLGYSRRSLSLDSVEWEQINKEYSIVYKNIFVCVAHILLVLPLLLLIIPQYRTKIKHLIQN